MPKLNDKKSVKVICRFDSLKNSIQLELSCHMSNAMLISPHAFDYMVLRIKPSLNICKDLDTVVVNSLDNN